MDYIFASLLKHKHPLLFLFLMYDIMCVWKLYLADRLKTLPPNVWLVLALALVSFAIPKMHIHGHKQWCQLLYSLNLLLGSAQTEGEGIEHVWAWIGGVAASTRAMGPGFRAETLNCQWSYWNWQKVIDIGTSVFPFRAAMGF
jgi:hypothetical protein